MSIEDHILLMSSQSPREIAASYCQHLYDHFEIKCVGGIAYQERVTVEKPLMSIDALRYYSPEPIRQRQRVKFGFDPNIMIAIFYTNPSLEIEALRNDVLRGLAGFIRTVNCDLAVAFQDDYVLNYHAGVLTLMEYPHIEWWSQERLSLFADFPYELKVQMTRRRRSQI